MPRHFALSFSLLLVLVSFAPIVHADAAAAEARFREGLKLMDDKNYDAACPKLAESNRQDPASGTLLALALCYERAGKLASAWSSYTDAAEQAKAEKKADREKAALQKVRELEPKLSKLTVVVSDEAKQISGLFLTLDGAALGAGSWNVATPVDAGKHRIDASAAGYKSFSASVDVGADRDQKSVEVGALDKSAGEAAPARAGQAAPIADEPAPKSSLKTYGLVAGGIGVVALGVGTVFALNAKKKNNDSNSDCSGNVCGDAGFAARQDARSAGNAATVAFIAGGVLVATGVTLYVVGGPSKNREAAKRRVRLAPVLAPGACGGFVQGTF